MKKSLTIFALALSCMGCATSTLMRDTGRNYEKTVRETLLQDTVVAFAQPAKPIRDMPNDNVVIVGQQYSYVLTNGGKNFVTVLSRLNPKNIKVSRGLDFYSEKNDVSFEEIFEKITIAVDKISEVAKKEIKNYEDDKVYIHRGLYEILSDI